jgi:DNA sulfur modification protein DndE
MHELDVKRVTFCTEADNRMRRLKAVTGVTPNLLCRVGFCLSLEERSVPDLDRYASGERIINRYTLTGEYDPLFVALLRQRLLEDDLDWEQCSGAQFTAHMNRGVLLVAARVKTLPDLMSLVSGPQLEPDVTI